MKIVLKDFCHLAYKVCGIKYSGITKHIKFITAVVFSLLFLFNTINANAQSGGWDAIGQNGSPGVIDHGSGVIQLTSPANTGCAGSAVHETTSTYNPCSGTTFTACYQVFFDCPTNDNIGADGKGDGMAFSFSNCAYNINNGLACGGGLGYMGACPKMITVEFDTYSSQGNSGFDATYGGGTTGINDEVALHFDGNASDVGRITSANAGNLEDGQFHTICIIYNPTTHILTVQIDGNNVLVYNFTSSPYDLCTYFGSVALNQTWSSGKFGATSQATVSNGTPINPSFFTSCTPMPVNLLSFTGKKLDQTVVLDWATSKEENNDRFVVERSANLRDWEDIGVVAGAGTVSVITNYNFVDTEPLWGKSYYRLRQVDIDGKYTQSKIVEIEWNAQQVTISPNPFENSFQISSDLSGEVLVKIYDVLGQLVYQSIQTSENGLMKIQPELTPGTYLVTIQTDSFITQQKLIRK